MSWTPLAQLLPELLRQDPVMWERVHRRTTRDQLLDRRVTREGKQVWMGIQVRLNQVASVASGASLSIPMTSIKKHLQQPAVRLRLLPRRAAMRNRDP
jgi:hypothetical protein